MFRFSCLLLLVFFSHKTLSSESEKSACKWDSQLKQESPEIFYVNMKESADRNVQIKIHLDEIGLPYRRVEALTTDNIYIPDNVKYDWIQFKPKSIPDSAIPNHSNKSFWSQHQQVSHVITGLDGRPKRNGWKEIACTTSHLEAIRRAIFENKTDNKYAVIIEDDVFIPFNINFTGLVESAPKDFAFLQLFNSDPTTVQHLWKRYNSRLRVLWHKRAEGRSDFWSTCAYLINREVLRPIISKLLYVSPVSNKYHFKLLAGSISPCRPMIPECCIYNSETKGYDFKNEIPCVLAPKGYQADSFLYSLGTTYVITVPLITNANSWATSTIHQFHVLGIQTLAFEKQREFINEFIKDIIPMPSFVSKACTKPIIEVLTNKTLT